MIRIIMNGCNGRMGQVISGMIAEDPELTMAAGIDPKDDGHNAYPVFSDITLCNVEADCLIDFSTASVVDRVIEYCAERGLPCVLCTTGLSGEQIQKVNEASRKTAILRSANMSLGINLFLKLLKKAADVLAPAGFDIEILEKHHNRKLHGPGAGGLHKRRV